MKKIFTTLLIGAMSGYAYAQENTKEVQAEIKTVTVFLEGAQVSRQARVALESGVTALSFRGIAPGINEQSIQISASSSVSILSVSFSVNYLDELKKPERLRELENEHKRLNDLIAQEQSLQAVYREEEVILKTNKSIGGTTEGVRTDELKVAMDYFRARLLEINNLLQESGKRVDGYTHNLARTDAQLGELKALKPQPSGEIVVKVSVAKNVLADLNIRYLVENARWFPSYDIRAVDVRSPVSITYKANVTQQSGEDWDNVTLTVSSANPSQGGARPIVRPWIIGFNNRLSDRTVIRGVAGLPYGAQQVSGRVAAASDGLGIPGANILIKGTSVGTTTDADGNFSLTLTADARVLVISFVGYGPQEIPIANQEFIQVSLEEDVQQLSETVAVGYGLYGSSSGYSNGYAARVKKVIMATPVVRQTDIEFTVQEPVSIT
ncbi:MAG TPA: mucoidy inhibitor MuiA family protein, partial [Cyclobacteriaceae bacterium]